MSKDNETAPYQKMKKSRYIFAVLLFLFIAIFSYGNILSGDFIWDDHCLVVNNPSIKQWYGLGHIFSSEVHLNTFTNYYRPVQIFSYKIDYFFFGLNPAGYHFINIFLHAFAGTLLFFLFISLTRHYFLSLATTLFFLVHPVNVSAVAYISGRADLLAALFIFASLLFYLKAFNLGPVRVLSLPGKGLCYYAGSLVMFILALLTKEVSIVLPFVLCGIDAFLLGNKGRFRRVCIFFVVVFIYFLARVTLFNFSSGNPFLCKKGFAIFDIGFFARSAIFVKTLLIYTGSIFIPVGLHMERIVAAENISLFLYIGVFLCILICTAAYRNLSAMPKNGRRIFYFAVFWFFIWLAPQSAFILPKIMADHFLYFPAIGLFLIVSMSMEVLRAKKILLVAVCFYFCSFTWFYTDIWKNEFEFFRWTSGHSPSSYKAHDCLADSYLKMGCLDNAVREYQSILNNSLHLVNSSDIDVLAFGPGKQEAQEALEKKREIASAVFYNIGVLLDRQGKLEQALTAYLNALKLRPASEQVYNNLGLVYEKMGDSRTAEKMYVQAIVLSKGYAQPYNNLAVLYAQRGDMIKAVKLWSDVLRLDPGYEVAKKNIALAREIIWDQKDGQTNGF